MRTGQVARIRLGGLRLAGVVSAAALLATAVGTLSPTSAPAAALDEQTCAQLKRDVVDLEGIGARNNMAKGPAWAKANLSSAQLEQIKKLIEIDEAVTFRCPRPKQAAEVRPVSAPGKAKVPVVKPLVKAAAKAPAADGTQAAVAPAVVKPKPKPKPVAAQPIDGEATAAAPPPRPRPKPPAPKRQDAVAPAE